MTVRAEAPTRTDAVTLEVIRHGLVAAAEQMAKAIERSAHSQVIREMLDYSTAVFVPTGGIVAQSAQLPIHLNSMSRALRTLLRDTPLSDGPKGTCSPPTTRIPAANTCPTSRPSRACSIDGVCVAITGTLGHHLDVGGRAPGSYGADATEIFQEGFRIPPTRIVAAGVPDEMFLRLFAANIRVPSKTLADLRAQIAALGIGAADVVRQARRYGAQQLLVASEELIAASERRMRAAVAALPAGVFEADDVIDSDGLDDEPVTVRVAVKHEGDEAGTSTSRGARRADPRADQLPDRLHRVGHVLRRKRGARSGRGPERRGLSADPRDRARGQLSSIRGSRHRWSAATSFAHRVASIVMAALGQALPERAVAPYYGNSNVYVLSTRDDRGQTSVHFEIEVGGWGARRPGRARRILGGYPQHRQHAHRARREASSPVASCSATGCVRTPAERGGSEVGSASCVAYEVLVPCELSSQFDRLRFPASRLHGGLAGATAQNRGRARKVAERDLPGKVVGYRLQVGDRLTTLPGRSRSVPPRPRFGPSPAMPSDPGDARRWKPRSSRGTSPS